MITLEFNIMQNILKIDKKIYLTTGSYKQVECNFNFLDETWNDLSKIAMFIMNGVAYSQIIVDNKCFVPSEALDIPGTLNIGVFGTETLNDLLLKRNTTSLFSIEVFPGSFSDKIEAELPSPSVFEQYILEMNKILDTAQSLINNINASNVNFSDGQSIQQKYDSGQLAGGSYDDTKLKQDLQIGDTNTLNSANLYTDNKVLDNSNNLKNYINEKKYITNTVNTLVNYYLKADIYNKGEIDTLISSINIINVLIVDNLPTENIKQNTIYFVSKNEILNNIYDEYMYINNKWEHIGTSEIDLSNYVIKSEILIKNSKILTTETIPENTDYIIPLNYKVGENVLEIYYQNCKLILNENYIEVGTSVSNKIQFLNWSVPISKNLEFMVRGKFNG